MHMHMYIDLICLGFPPFYLFWDCFIVDPAPNFLQRNSDALHES